MMVKIQKTFKNRISKCVRIITQIQNLLELINFSPYLIEIALLLRESMLIKGTLTNVEVWHNLTNNEVKEFEDLDKMFLRKVFPYLTPQKHSTWNQESFLLE